MGNFAWVNPGDPTEAVCAQLSKKKKKPAQTESEGTLLWSERFRSRSRVCASQPAPLSLSTRTASPPGRFLLRTAAAHTLPCCFSLALSAQGVQAPLEREGEEGKEGEGAGMEAAGSRGRSLTNASRQKRRGGKLGDSEVQVSEGLVVPVSGSPAFWRDCDGFFFYRPRG